MKKYTVILTILFACAGACGLHAQTIKGDTLFIDKPVKFINIGGRIYEIQAPTLKEVLVPETFNLWKGGGGNFINASGFTTPAVMSDKFSWPATLDIPKPKQ